MPITSSKMWGLMQAKARGSSKFSGGPSAEVAHEMIEKTPPSERSKFARQQAKRRRGRSTRR